MTVAPPFRIACIVLLVAGLALAGPVAAQSVERPNRDVLGPQLRSLFRDGAVAKARSGSYPGEMKPLHLQIHSESTAKSTPSVDPASAQYGVIVYTNRPGMLRGAGVEYNSAFDDFVTARMTPSEIAAASRVDGVEQMRAAGVAHPLNDVAAGLTGARALNHGRLNDTKYTGTGTFVCVIDTGIDFMHGDFRALSDDSQSRIHSIWDQTLSPQPDEDSPSGRHAESSFSGFTYGVEYTRSEIEDEFGGSSADYVREEDTHGHGTHVTGTAAGNGGAHPQEKYKGLAPEADIIVVKGGNGSFPFTNVVDGMNYCGAVAESQNRPVVVNMSIGASFGPHDGTSFQDQAIDQFVSAESGRAVVTSAGNDGNSNMHTSNTIEGGGVGTFEVVVPDSVGSGEFRIDSWLNGDEDASIQVETPTGITAGPLSPSDPDHELIESTSDGRVRLVNEVPGSLGDGDRRLYVEVDDDSSTAPAEGTWTVSVNNSSATTVTHHAWLYDDHVAGDVSAALPAGNSAYTITTPGSAKNVISVGAWVHRWRWCTESAGCYLYSSTSDRSDGRAAFSSVGPLRDGTQKPDLVAPGQGTGSSASDDRGSIPSSRRLSGGKHWILQGTSMASPATAGAVALLLQQNPGLSHQQITSSLETTARTDDFTGSVPNDEWGAGKLDVLQAMTQQLGAASDNRRREILAYDQWGNGMARVIGGSEKVAVRFTPSFTGVASGVLFHSSSTVDLSGPVRVEIWSDDGNGFPDQQLGATVSWPQGTVSGYSWNYLDLTAAGVNVHAGTDYHVVVSKSENNDDLSIRYETTSVDDRSTYFQGSTWASFGSGDFRLRPIVSTFHRQVTVAGTDGTGNDAGWRLLAPPADATRSDLNGDLDFSVDSGALLHQWTGSSWSAVSNGSTSLPRGEGFILYFFDDAVDPVTADGITLDVPNGTEDMSADETVSGLAAEDRFHLLGNPFNVAFDLSALRDGAGNGLAAAGFQAAAQVWDPDASQWTTITEGAGADSLAAWQGFFVQRSSTGSGATSLTFRASGKEAGFGSVIGSKAGTDAQESAPAGALVDLDLTVTTSSDTLVADGAAVLFDDRASEGWDAFEATQLSPPKTDQYAALNSPILRDDRLVHRTQASLPYPTESSELSVPLSVQAVDAGGTATLAWPEPNRTDHLSDWTVELEDTESDARVNLRQAAYEFTLESGDGSLTTPDDARFQLLVTPPSTIPVELTGLEAQRDGGDAVRLEWQTASETQNSGFYVQRRGDTAPGSRSPEWTRLGFVESKATGGTTNEPLQYRFRDTTLPFGTDSLTYRLRQVDADGTAHLSEAVTVHRGVPNRVTLKAPFPNPTHRRATVRFTTPAPTDVRLVLYDVLGRRVATSVDGPVEAGRHTHRLDTGALSAGTYLLRLTTDDAVRTRKLTVLH